MKKSAIIFSVILGIIIIIFVASPQTYMASFTNGLIVWVNILLPSIFPFLFFTKLLTSLGVINIISQKFAFTNKLFKTPPISAYAFCISILSGYPVGAKVVSDLYSNNLLSKRDAIKTTTFTSNSGPMFIYGTVGIGLLHSKTLGLIILFSHIIGAILNGILYRNHGEKSQKVSFCNSTHEQSKPFSIGDSMWDSVVSIFVIGGFVCIFFVIIDILNNLYIFAPLSIFLANIFQVDPQIFVSIFNGLVEMTHGCLDLTSCNLSTLSSVILCTFIITFGGLATMLQAYVFLQKIGIRFSFFIKQKLTHSILASIVCAILLLIFT